MERLIKQFNNLKIEGMPILKKLYGKKGEALNTECVLPNGVNMKILDNSKMYYFAELNKEGSEDIFRLITDKQQLAVIEYLPSTKESKLIIWKRI